MTTDAPTEDQRARWLKHPLRKIHYSEVEYIDLCAAITAEAITAERARLAKVEALYIREQATCAHEFNGFSAFHDERGKVIGGEQICSKCGLGAMSHSLRTSQ